MKRLWLFAMLLTAVFCSGCSEIQINTNSEDVDNVELIRTVGIDRAESGITMTVCSGVGLNESEPKMYKTEAETAAGALNALENSYTREKAFFSHTEHLVIGEEAAKEGMDGYLDFAARVMQMRLDTNLFIVKGASAEELITETATGSTAAADMLTAIEQEIQNVSEGHVYTCGEVLSSLVKNGYALVQAVEIVPSAQLSKEGDEKGVHPAGYAVISSGAVIEFIDPELSRGVSIATAKASGGVVPVPDGEEGYVSLKVTGYDVKYEAQYSDSGDMEKVLATVHMHSELKQMDTAIDIMNDKVREALAKELAEIIYYQVKDSINLSQQMGIDFLNIGSRLRMSHPDKFDKCDWESVFPEMEINLTVSADIKRTYDMIQGLRTDGGGGAENE